MIKYHFKNLLKGGMAMRRFLALILCCLLFVMTAYADNAVSGVQANAAVSADGSCQVSLSMSIRLDEPVSSLELPLGTKVSSVRLNGGSASVSRSGGVTSVSLNRLTRNVTGTVPVMVTYTVNSVVSLDESGKQIITVPLLYGFTYPVEDMSFSITMPGPFDTVPTFLSGYHQQDIESSITSSVSGATITGTVNTTLKDHETLTMTLEAPEGMFPQVQTAGGSLRFDMIAMIVCGVLALVYWLCTMSCWPRLRRQRSTPPEGVTAGNLGSFLVHKGADLTMMVVSWAQLGYLIIHLDENGRVMLHKKMDMGNERSAFEGRTFRSLFAKGNAIDATGYRYARLCESASILSARQAWGYRSNTGNPKILRLLGCGVGLFAGIAIGDCLASSAAWRVILMILLGVGGSFGAWYIQEGAYYLQLRQKLEMILGGLCIAAFLTLGLLSGCFFYGLAAALGNALIGLLAAHTGRRTENGNQIRDEILGLRRYLCKATKPELMRILRSNPDYYYELAPYALALGVDKTFAKRFGSLRLSGCTWLITDMGPAGTALEWHLQLREAVEAMTNLQKRPPWEKFLKVNFNFR